jgi:cysteine synthase B
MTTPAQLGSSVYNLIGNTPLIRLDKVARDLPHITVLAKCEWTNPAGSVKDRPAASIVQDAQARGLLVPGKTLLDATSGNTGIAFAMLGAALGFPVHLAMPSNVSPERKRILKAYGATIDWTAPDEGSDGAIRRARELAGNDPKRFFYADQYSNDANCSPTTAPPPPKSGPRPPAASPTSSPASAPVAPSWARRAASRSSTPPSRPSAFSLTRPSTASKA